MARNTAADERTDALNAAVDDETIRDAIGRHDDPDHPDAVTVGDMRDLLSAMQEIVEEFWGEWQDNIERGDTQIIAETGDVIVMDTGEISKFDEELEHHPDVDELKRQTRYALSQIVHSLARQHCDRNWSVSYPMVVGNSDAIELE